MPRPRPDEEDVAEHLGGAGLLALDQLDRAADGRRAELVTALEQPDELLEQQPDALGLPLGAGDRDLVPANDDLGVERGLDELQQLVALAEEGDHALVSGNQDLDVRGGSRQAVLFGVVPRSSSSVMGPSSDAPD